MRKRQPRHSNAFYRNLLTMPYHHLTIEKQMHEKDKARMHSRSTHVSKQPHETNYQQRRSAVSKLGRSHYEDAYMAVSNHPHQDRVCAVQVTMHEKSQLHTPVQLGQGIVNIESELGWLSPRSSLLHEYLSPGEASFDGQPQKSLEFTRPIMEEEEEDMGISDGAGTPPELDEGYQTSDSGGFSLAEELVAQYLGTEYPMDFEIPCKPFRNSTTSVYQDQCLSRFSWGSSTDSGAERESMMEHDVWWNPVRPMSERLQKQSPPPIPPRNPRRLLKAVNEVAPKGFSDAARGSRNIKNLHLSLAKPKTEEAGASSNNSPVSRRVQPDPRYAPTNSMRSSMSSKTKTSPTNHIVSAMSETSRKLQPKSSLRGFENAQESRQVVGSGTLVYPPCRRCQSSRYIGSTNRSAETLNRSHSRGSSESVYIGTKKNKTLDKWEPSMLPPSSIRRSCTTSVAKNTKLRAPLLPFDINKRLPPLPAVAQVLR